MRNLVREIRVRAGLSQGELSVRTRISQGRLSLLERGLEHAWPDWRRRIAEALQVEESTLFPELAKDAETTNG